MKIALLTPRGVYRTGEERIVPCLHWLIEQLSQVGHEVHVFASRQEPQSGTWPLLSGTVHDAGGGPGHPRMLGARRLRFARCRLGYPLADRSRSSFTGFGSTKSSSSPGSCASQTAAGDRAADLLVMAWRHEAGPVVMLEAVLAGMRPVGTCVGHSTDHWPVSALAAPVGQRAATAEPTCTLSPDEERRLAMVAAAHADATHQDASFTVRSFEAVYWSVSHG